MASFDRRYKSTCWLGMVLMFLASNASSENTTENATTLLSSMALPSESEYIFISNGEFTSIFSTMVSADLDPSNGMSITVMISPNTAQIAPSETNTHESSFAELTKTTAHTGTPISSEMASPSSQHSASSVRYSNSEPLQSTLMILESSSMRPVSSDPDGVVSSIALTPRITPEISTGDHLTKATMEPPNASETTNSAFQTPSVSSTDAKGTATSVFEDLTTKFMTAKASEYSELTTSTMTSEGTGYSSPKPNIVISSTLQDSSITDMKTPSETILSPSMTSHTSSALILSSVQHSSSAMGRRSLSTEVHEKTTDTIGLTTLRTVLQPSRTADADRFTKELSRLQTNIDDLEDEVNGWRIAVAILASCLGLILLVVVIRLIIKWRQRDQPAKLATGGVDDITRKEVLNMRKNENRTFFRRPGSSNILDKGLNRISSIFNKRSSNSHEFETFSGAHSPESSVMEEVDETEIAGGKTDVQMTQFRPKDNEGNGEPKMNGDGQEIRHSFTEVDLH